MRNSMIRKMLFTHYRRMSLPWPILVLEPFYGINHASSVAYTSTKQGWGMLLLQWHDNRFEVQPFFLQGSQ